jgi:hypothetical protein
MRKKSIAILGVVFCGLVFSKTLSACTCLDLPPSTDLERADVVFSGKIVSGPTEGSSNYRYWTTEVAGIWKGRVSSRVRIYGYVPPKGVTETCGAPEFDKNETYMFFLRNRKGKSGFTANICDATEKLSDWSNVLSQWHEEEFWSRLTKTKPQ